MQNDIIIHWRDQLRCRIECNPGVAYEMAEEFSFFVNGYKFMPQYKAGRWDGKIRMFDVKNRGFYIGLLERLFDWSQEQGYTIGFAHPEDFKHEVEFEDERFEKILKIGKFEPKWYQKDALEAVLKHNKLIILSPTGSGKSFIIYLIIRYMQEVLDNDILITVPSKMLVEQLYADFADYSVDGWDVEENVHKLYGGKDKDLKLPVTVSTWQTACKMPQSWFNRFGCYMCDEAHGADAKSISAIIDKLAHAPIRVGLTGTLDGTVMHQLDMEARFGKIVRVASTKQLMDDGDLADLDIDCIQLKYKKEDVETVKHLNYQQEVDFIVSHERRNKFLAAVAMQTKGNTLMLFNYIQRHGEILYRILEPLCKAQGKKLYYIHGQTDVDDREKIRQILEKESNAILLASFGTLSTGVNIKNLHNVIFCHPYKAVIKTLQSIGRTLRLAAGKDKATLIDIADDLSYTTRGGVKKQNTILRHFLERLKVYVTEQFKYKIIPVNL